MRNFFIGLVIGLLFIPVFSYVSDAFLYWQHDMNIEDYNDIEKYAQVWKPTFDLTGPLNPEGNVGMVSRNYGFSLVKRNPVVRINGHDIQKLCFSQAEGPYIRQPSSLSLAITLKDKKRQEIIEALERTENQDFLVLHLFGQEVASLENFKDTAGKYRLAHYEELDKPDMVFRAEEGEIMELLSVARNLGGSTPAEACDASVDLHKIHLWDRLVQRTWEK